MDLDIVIDAFGVSLVIVIVLFVVVAAIVYAVIKRKKDYRPGNGVPKRVEKPERTQGSSNG